MDEEMDREEEGLCVCASIGRVVDELVPEGYAFIFGMCKIGEVEATIHTVCNMDEFDTGKLIGALNESYNGRDRTIN